MAYYNQNKQVVGEFFDGSKWFTPVECELEEKEGFEIVFDETKSEWKYIPHSDWNKYLYDIGLLKLSNKQKFDSLNNIVDKNIDELLLEKIISQEEYNQIKRRDIDSQLFQIDLKTIRALRENDTQFIEKYKTDAIKLREERKKFI